MQTIKAIYEDGVFRPIGPVELPEGAWVEVNPIKQNGTQPTANGQVSSLITPLMGEALAVLLERIDALPLEGYADPDLSTTYRGILYPKEA